VPPDSVGSAVRLVVSPGLTEYDRFGANRSGRAQLKSGGSESSLPTCRRACVT